MGDVELSVPNHHAIDTLLSFVDSTIDGFPDYYFKSTKSDRENFITSLLVNYLNGWLIDESAGYIPYKFSFQKNPAQDDSTKETDIGIFILNPSVPGATIFEFEAKRLSDSSNNSEYVFGRRGGIERFKRNDHAKHLKKAGMFGYIQSKTSVYWHSKINEWINQKSSDITDGIDWTSQPEKLVADASAKDKFSSTNARIGSDSIFLLHYFIDLTVKN
jgi:hypothetical protein